MPRELKPCGTEAAARRHARHDEPLCEACREAERQAQRERAGAMPRAAAACGTPSGHQRHYRAGEPACKACLAAKAKDVRERRANRKAANRG